MPAWACAAWLLLGLALASAAMAQRPPAVVPTDRDQVLERLPRGYARLALPVQRAKAATPADIQRLLTTAARTGDARLAARAEALLARYPLDTSDSRVLHARAYSRQYRHDFDGAAALLDTLVARNPRDGDARLARAQLNVVRGHLGRVRADCVALVLGVDAASGALCVGMLALRSGDHAAAAQAVDRWLAENAGARNTSPERLHHALLLRAEIAARANAPDADARFRRALSVAPGDVHTLVSYARHLRAQRRDREALALLADAPDNDGVRLQQALAARHGDPPRAAALAAAQGRRYALVHTLGSEPELRDEAEYLLVLRGDANAALALAQRNFQNQRDHEDVDILQRAAVAAGRPETLAPLQAWAASQRLRLPAGQPR